MNHVTTDAPLYVQNNDWFWPDDNGTGGNCVCGQGCPGFNTVCWFDTFLPTFNMLDADARRWSVDNAIHVGPELGIDGFRLDAVKQVEAVWFTDTRARVERRARAGSAVLHGRRDVRRRSRSHQVVRRPAHELDGQFDFPLRAQVLSTLLHRDGQMSDLVDSSSRTTASTDRAR